MLKRYTLTLFLLLLTSCSKVTRVTSQGVTQYYGINLIDMNNDANLSYNKVEGIGLIYGANSLSLGYVQEEQIYANPKICQAILIVDSNNTNMNKLLEKVKNLCIIRR